MAKASGQSERSKQAAPVEPNDALRSGSTFFRQGPGSGNIRKMGSSGTGEAGAGAYGTPRRPTRGMGHRHGIRAFSGKVADRSGTGRSRKSRKKKLIARTRERELIRRPTWSSHLRESPNGDKAVNRQEKPYPTYQWESAIALLCMSGWLAVPKMMRNVSLIRSSYLSLRYHGLCIVGRGSRVRVEHGARIEFDPGSRLIIGMHRWAPAPCWVVLEHDSRLSIRGEVEFMRGTRVVVSQGAHFEMGDHSAIHCNATLTCLEHISIGRECGISWNTNIIDGNGHELSIDLVPRPVSVPVAIGDHVWIGAGASVLSGVTIGSGAVVAAGSMVTKDVPCRTLVAGSPAKVVGKNVDWVR